MRFEERARRATEGIRRAVDGPRSAERFHRYRERKQRNQRIGAGLLAAGLAALVVVVAIRAVGDERKNVVGTGPGSGGVILYGRWNAKLQQASWFTVRADGTGTHDLRLVATCAVWWPDGSRILITDDAAVGPGRPLRPATINPDGSGTRPLDATRDKRLNLGCGDVSPDGTRLVLEGFNESHRVVNGIYTVRASDGGGLARLTSSPRGTSDGNPQYSPDGKQVAFFRTKPGINPNGAGALFVVDIDGRNLRRITPWGYAFLGQSWSPDGRWIAFEKPYGELFVVHPDGTGLHRIPVRLPSGAGATNPDWSPDGTRIAFSLQRYGRADIFTVRPDGTGLTQATHTGRSNDQTPDWGA